MGNTQHTLTGKGRADRRRLGDALSKDVDALLLASPEPRHRMDSSCGYSCFLVLVFVSASILSIIKAMRAT